MLCAYIFLKLHNSSLKHHPHSIVENTKARNGSISSQGYQRGQSGKSGFELGSLVSKACTPQFLAVLPFPIHPLQTHPQQECQQQYLTKARISFPFLYLDFHYKKYLLQGWGDSSSSKRLPRHKLDNLRSIPERTQRLKERTDSTKLSFDLHVLAVAHAPTFTHPTLA